MKKKRTARSAFFNLRALLALLLCTAAAVSTSTGTLLAFFRSDAPTKASYPVAARLTFAERVVYQRAIEQVYWRHRIWPKERPDPKPSLEAVMSQAQLEKKVAEYLRTSQVLGDYCQRPLTAEQLQAEMDRVAQHTKQPKVLRELFQALGNDPFVIAECLARPILSERLKLARPLDSWRAGAEKQMPKLTAAVSASYVLPVIASPSGGCTNDMWTPTSRTNAQVGRTQHTAVWTGSEMIVWGGVNSGGYLNTGGRYNPGTDSWTATSTIGAASDRALHRAVWTGSEMIVWGGGNPGLLNTGGRYNPGTDRRAATSNTSATAGRFSPTGVWTGSEMIVWGGDNGDG